MPPVAAPQPPSSRPPAARKPTHFRSLAAAFVAGLVIGAFVARSWVSLGGHDWLLDEMAREAQASADALRLAEERRRDGK